MPVVVLAVGSSPAVAAEVGLTALRKACKAPDARLVVDEAALAAHFDTDPDWPFNASVLETRIDDLLFDIACACDENDVQMVEWKVVDKIVKRAQGNGTRFERPERRVPVQKLAGTREIRVVFEPAYLTRKAALSSGEDARDWLTRFLSPLYDRALVKEDVQNLMSTIGMPPTVRVEGGVLTLGLSPASTTVGSLDGVFVRLFDLALAGKPTAPGAKPPARPARE